MPIEESLSVCQSAKYIVEQTEPLNLMMILHFFFFPSGIEGRLFCGGNLNNVLHPFPFSSEKGTNTLKKRKKKRKKKEIYTYLLLSSAFFYHKFLFLMVAVCVSEMKFHFLLDNNDL